MARVEAITTMDARETPAIPLLVIMRVKSMSACWEKLKSML